MSTVACPNGHLSADPEWCDTCGAKIGADPAIPNPASPDPASPEPARADRGADPSVGSMGSAGRATQSCPNCHTVNPADNLFCEQCGYDFTTGQTPPEPAVLDEPVVLDDELPAAARRWVVIVEIDPEWYALKGALADQPCPPSSSSSIALHRRTSLVGRSSQSLGLRPEIGLDTDTGVSRRHAQFLCDGDTVSVIDLSSTNGTYVVRAPAGSPDEDTLPLDPGVATDLADGDCVYVGAWSRLTLRKS